MSHTVRRLVHTMRAGNVHARSTGEAGATTVRAMREANRSLILNYLREHGPLARVSISRRTGLSRTTVSSIVDALIKEGLVREGSTQNAARSGGRRAILVHFNESAGTVLGVDMGRSHLIIVATNLAAEVVARHSGGFDATQGPEVCLPLLVAELNRFVERQHLTWDSIVGIGLGIPGPMDARVRMLISPPRMPGWHGVDVQRILRRELHVPIYLGNDANMGALGESRFGAGRGIEDFAYVKLGTGIGCGMVIDGQVYRGSRGTAGELGHVTIEENGPRCDCGNRGCLEAVAAASSIVRDAVSGTSINRKRARDGLPPVEGVLARREPDGVDVAEVVQAALAGDLASQAAIERAGELVGIALASLVNLFNPSVIVVDGSVSRAGDLLLVPIRRAIATRSLSAASSDIRMITAELGENAIALGAVSAVLDAVFHIPVPAGRFMALPESPEPAEASRAESLPS